MNNTINNKVIKKKLMKTKPINKLDKNEEYKVDAPSGHSLQKRQQYQLQQEENKEMVIKKKLKLKQKSKICSENITNKTKQPLQKYKKCNKKIPKQNENELPKNDIDTSLPHPPESVFRNEHSKQVNSPTITKNEKSSLEVKTFLQERNREQDQDVEYYHEKVYMFMKSLKCDYKRLTVIYNYCIKSEQERQKRNEEEIDELKKIYNRLQVERINIKRKRWCRYCESEATYLNSKGINFYCSIECEEKQKDLVNVIEEIFKT